MKSKITAIYGILGALLFMATSVVSSFQLEGYDRLSQFISEAYAAGTPYGLYFRIFGYIPSGILLALFGFRAGGYFKKSHVIKWGFRGFAVFYGIAIVLVGIFPCDLGCTFDWANSSFSQIAHNILSGLTYLVVPWCLIAVGIGFRRLKAGFVGNISLILGGIDIVFVLLVLSDPGSPLAGLYQRIVEACILSWVFIVAVHIFSGKRRIKS